MMYLLSLAIFLWTVVFEIKLTKLRLKLKLYVFQIRSQFRQVVGFPAAVFQADVITEHQPLAADVQRAAERNARQNALLRFWRQNKYPSLQPDRPAWIRFFEVRHSNPFLLRDQGPHGACEGLLETGQISLCDVWNYLFKHRKIVIFTDMIFYYSSFI